MALAKVSGIVSAVRDRTTTQVDTTNKTTTEKHSVAFRIDNRPATLAARANLNEGDRVTAVGRDAGELEVVVLRNDTTNVYYSTGDDLTGVGWVLVVLSIPVVLMFTGVRIQDWGMAEWVETIVGITALMGFIFVPGAIYCFFKGWAFKKAVTLLNSA